jgi:hypothetical protein
MLGQQYIRGIDWGVGVYAEHGKIRNWVTFECPDYHATHFAPNPELLDMVARLIAATGYTGVANFDARR